MTRRGEKLARLTRLPSNSLNFALTLFMQGIPFLVDQDLVGPYFHATFL